MNTVERFWDKVQQSDGCWLWTGAKSSAGYGQVKIADKVLYAHRYVLELSGVVIASDRVVDHVCANRGCVRPEHLRLATTKQNNEHRIGPNRNSKSGVRGVYYCNTFHKWFGSVTHLRRKYCKSFLTLEEANAWTVAKRNELFSHNVADRVGA